MCFTWFGRQSVLELLVVVEEVSLSLSLLLCLLDSFIVLKNLLD